jgi:hypothetical protein
MNNITLLMIVICVVNAIWALFGGNEYAHIHSALGWLAAGSLWASKTFN